MSAEYTTRTSALAVTKQGASMFDDQAISIEIGDEGGGEFVIVRQSLVDTNYELRIAPEEWPTNDQKDSHTIAPLDAVVEPHTQENEK